MNEDGCLPAVRPLEVVPFVAEDGETMFALHDHSRIAPRNIAVSMAGYFILAQLDGRRTCPEIQTAFAQQFNMKITAQQVHDLVAALDEGLLLATERFERTYAARRDAYLAGDARDNRDRYADEPVLRPQLEAMLDHPSPRVPGLRGLVAPHLDYTRGRPCYADAYSSLRNSLAAERYVILGTNHYGRSRCVVATDKDFVTPLGRVPTDRALLARVEERLSESLRGHEFDHDAEHSVELQVHLLQACQPEQPFSIVPFLCPDPGGPSGTQPADGNGPGLDEFSDALASVLAEDDQPTVIIAGADLSHVGQRFGDAKPTTQAFLEQVWKQDRALLSLLEAGRTRDFVEQARTAGNPTRICSLGCLYVLRRTLADADCRMLRYHQAVDMPAETHVTCAAAVLA